LGDHADISETLSRRGSAEEFPGKLNSAMILLGAFLIGFFAGLRSLTAPALAAWAVTWIG